MVKNTVKTSVINLANKDKSFLDSLCKISTLEKNLGCIDGKIIGTGRSDYTQGSTEYKLLVNDNEFLLIDIPGIEGDESKYKATIKESLAKAHLIFYVNGSGKKAEKNTLEKIHLYDDARGCRGQRQRCGHSHRGGDPHRQHRDL